MNSVDQVGTEGIDNGDRWWVVRLRGRRVGSRGGESRGETYPGEMNREEG